ncbi:MAG TPA: hypothetical protein VD788_12560 [Candidatus Polarisedimenticolaceae bacterium]|nr:hypothetical protein [Candidatus Polarisedimenticolaceae bacterium]
MKQPRSIPAAVLPAATLALSLACNVSVNGPIHVADGETRENGLATVNGSLTVGRDCRIAGACSVVNGEIEIGEGSSVGGLNAVNGPIRVGPRVTVDGDVDSVNGPISLASGTIVGGEVSTINGPIELDGTTVGEHVRTVNGDLQLSRSSVVKGNVVIERKIGGVRADRPLTVLIDTGSVVEGDLIVEDPDLPVKVYLRHGGRVNGEIRNAEVVRDAT